MPPLAHNGSYYPYIATLGKIEFSAKTESASSVTVDVKEGQVYYIKGTVGMGAFIARPNLAIVSPEIGEKQIAECKLIPEKK